MAWRKSWSNLNIFGSNGDGVCKKRALLPSERSVLDDYLDLAEISPIRGRVCIANNIGYTQEQLSEILKTPLPIIKETERKLLKNKTIEIKGRVVIIKNWTKYQSEYERQKRYRVTNNSYNKKLQRKDTKNPSLSLSLSLSLSISSKKEFESIWLKYPSRVGKEAAKRHFKVSVKTPEDLTNINRALENYLKSERVRKGYIQNGSTWFNDWDSWVNYKPPAIEVINKEEETMKRIRGEK